MGLTTEEWVKQTMGGYAKLALEDRLDSVKNLTEAGYSQQLTAEIIGVSRVTVNKDVKKLTDRAGKEATSRARSQAEAWLQR
jgi:transposase